MAGTVLDLGYNKNKIFNIPCFCLSLDLRRDTDEQSNIM